MKQTIKLLALLLMPFLMISSCTDDELPKSVVASSASKSLSLSSNYLTLTSENNKVTLDVKASKGVSWAFVEYPDWISITPSSGTGPEKVTVYFDGNYQERKRTATFYIKNTDPGWSALIKVDVVQAGQGGDPDDPDDPDNPDNPDTPPVYEGVDLGLSVLWATFNVGASAPEGYGNYYAWGETETKNEYTWSTYQLGLGDEYSLTKYVSERWADTYGNNGFYDNKLVLEEQDDVAHVKWGERWRMADMDEFLELINLCTWTETTKNGIKGYQVTSNIEGYTNRSIFLPFAGNKDTLRTDDLGQTGYYWASEIPAGNASKYASFFISTDRSMNYVADRYLGLSVRPVVPSDTWRGITAVSLEKALADLRTGGSIKLTVSIWSGSYDYSFLSPKVNWSSSNTGVATVNAAGVVTGVSAGDAIITAEYNGFEAKCMVTVTDYTPVCEYVDLGLSVKWATCNVGAESPEEAGFYYAWGETEIKDTYNWGNYKWYVASEDLLSKYCNESTGGGYADYLKTLQMGDDAASVMWGSEWHIPTADEFSELIDYCSWTYTTVNNVSGYLITSNVPGYTDNSIFLPSVGYRSNATLQTGIDAYWTSSVSEEDYNNAWYANCTSNGSLLSKGAPRPMGMAVRPVCASDTWSGVEPKVGVDLGLSVYWATCNIGASRSEQYGKYFKWGETEPKRYYDWATYKWAAGSTTTITRYNNIESYGTVDNVCVLYPEDDAATMLWGEGWRMPTLDEFNELVTKCSWTWGTQNGINGYYVTGNNNTIFLPAAGSYGANFKGEKGDAGYYWTSYLYTDQPDCSWSLAFNQEGVDGYCATGRAVCAPIRPVSSKSTTPDFSEVFDYYENIGEVQKSDDIYIIVTDYIDNKIKYVQDPRIIKDPLNTSNKCIVLSTNPGPYANYDTYLRIFSGSSFNKGQVVKLSMKVRADNNQNSNAVTINSSSMEYMNSFESPVFTTKWTEYIAFITITNYEESVFGIDLSYLQNGNNCYFDDITLTVVEPNNFTYYDYYACKSGIILNDNVSIIAKGDYYSGEPHYNEIPRVTDDPFDASNKCIIIQTQPSAGTYSNYETECFISLSEAPEPGSTVTVSMRIRADKPWTTTALIQRGPGDYSRGSTFSPPTFTTKWENYSFSFVTNENERTVSILCSKYEDSNNLYFDDISVQIEGYHDYVDLGLSVKWATCNLGASRPEEYGDYYAWGETEPYYEPGYAQEDPQAHWKSGYTKGYDWTSYSYTTSNDKFSKYTGSDDSYATSGTADGKTTLDAADDVAHVKWGGSWRMPTMAEQEELLSNCDWEWVDNFKSTGVAGCLVTSKVSGYTDRSIFLPAAGCRNGTGLIGISGMGLYSSSSLQSIYSPWNIFITPSSAKTESTQRNHGLSVRPVCP